MTIKEIAAEAGVSVMTVSNVINNNTSKVSQKTAEKVRAIMAQHQYVPNMAARSLSSKSSHIIALLLPLWYDSTSSMLHDPYTGQLVGCLEELLREREYYVMLCTFRNAEQALNISRRWKVDGMVLVLPHEDDVTREVVKQTETPLVVMDRHYEDLPSLSVCLDDFQGGYVATRHVLEMGHRRVGFVCPSLYDSSVIRDRFLGFQKALEEFGVKDEPAWHFDQINRMEGGEKLGEKLAGMERRPTAIVTTEDQIACGIVKGWQKSGLRVPEDLSVVGFDNSTLSTLITPALTTVAQDVHAKAEHAVNMLMRSIGEEDYRRDLVVLPVSLIRRDTVTGPAEKRVG